MRGEGEKAQVQIAEEVDNEKLLLESKDADIFKKKEIDSIVAIDRNALIDSEE